MTEWYYAEGQQRQGPFPVIEIRQRFQRGQLTLDTLVWREGMSQWAAVRQVVDELGLQTLADATSSSASGGFDLRGDYAAIDNGTAPLPGTGALSSSPYSAPGTAGGDASQVVHGGEVVYAGFWKRFAAVMIDQMLLAIPVMIINVTLALVGMTGDDGSWIGIVAQLLSSLLNILLGFAYYGWFHASRGGATPGKMAVGIKVVRLDGERLTLLRSMGRHLASALGYLTFFVGFIMAGFTERRQALHDMICETVVVDRWAYTDQPHLQRRELGTVTVVVLAIAALAVVAGIILMILAATLLAGSFSDLAR